MLRAVVGLAVVAVGVVVILAQERCEEWDLTDVEDTGCRQFRICDRAGRWSRPLDCAPGTLFDPVKKWCEFRRLVTCRQRPNAGCRPGLTPGSGCRNFTLCVFNTSFTIPCGNNTVFSRSYGVCVWPRRLSTEDRLLC